MIVVPESIPTKPTGKKDSKRRMSESHRRVEDIVVKFETISQSLYLRVEEKVPIIQIITIRAALVDADKRGYHGAQTQMRQHSKAGARDILC